MNPDSTALALGIYLNKQSMFQKKVIDNRKKNTKRKITPEVAYEVKARD